MPRLISREDALAAIRAEGGEPACLMCAVVARRVGPVYAVYEDPEMLVMLPRYVRRWGHLMVVPKAHATTYTEIDAAAWARASALAHLGARVVERVRSPRRCYLASIGSNAGVRELTQSSKHLHLHVIPLYEPDDRPSDVFSWAQGVYVGEPDEWAELQAAYREAWSALETSGGSVGA